MLYKPGIGGMIICFTIFLAGLYNVTISISWLFAAFFMAFLLCSATPSVPGGFLAGCAMTAAVLDLPQEALAIMVATNVVLDFFRTAFNVTMVQFEMINAALRLELIDQEKLRADV